MTASRFHLTTSCLTQSKSTRLRTAAYCLLAVLLFTVAIGFFVSPSPAYAIADPGAGNITIKSIDAYTSIWEQGDMLFVLSYDIVYGNVTGLGYASDSFAFTIYSTDGLTMLGMYPAIDYQYKLSSIYFSAAAVLADGLVTGAKYKVRIGGTPTAFPGGTTEDVNMDTWTMATSDWYIGTQTANTASLKANILTIMAAIEAHDDAIGNVTYLLTSIKNTKLLSDITQDCVTPCSGLYWSGKNMVLSAIPNLDDKIPDMFASAEQSFALYTLEGTGTLQAESSMVLRLGVAFTNAFAGIGTYFGISTQWAAGIFWSIIMSIAAMIIFVYSGNSLAAMILVLPLLLMGNYLGIVPLVVTFVLAILLVVYMGYHIYLRGMV